MAAVRRSWISSNQTLSQDSLSGSSSVDPITAHLMGGLGNQLFTFGAGKALARSLNCDVCFDVSWFDSQTLRQFELGFLDADLRLVHSPVKHPLAFQRLIRRFREPTKQSHVFREKSFAYDPNFWNVVPGMSIHGYFQSWKYLDPLAAEIRYMVLNSTADSDWFRSEQQKLKALGSWTSVHVRRGDYTNPGTHEFHGLVRRNYYEKAVRVVDDLLGQQPLVVFSDDEDSARKELEGLHPNIHFVETPNDVAPHESLRLMALAPTSIIANSSFSWWGAWLSDHPKKVVVAPRTWFNNQATNERDLFPPHWIALGR